MLLFGLNQGLDDSKPVAFIFFNLNFKMQFWRVKNRTSSLTTMHKSNTLSPTSNYASRLQNPQTLGFSFEQDLTVKILAPTSMNRSPKRSQILKQKENHLSLFGSGWRWWHVADLVVGCGVRGG